jgi:F-type H+-transporting ATPase subunit delta
MSNYRVIKRYALALLEDAQLTGKGEKIFADADFFVKACRENRDFLLILKNPVINKTKKQSILEHIFSTSFDPTSMSFIVLLLKHNREDLLKEIFEEFILQYKNSKGIMMAEVISSTPLDDLLIQKIKKIIIKITGYKEVELLNTIKSNLIGGIALKFEGKLIDLTIDNQIIQLKKYLKG